MAKYDPKEVEPRWRERWEKENVFRTRTREEVGDRPKYYVLEMFPYPSGAIHMVHARNYVMGDVVARFKALNIDSRQNTPNEFRTFVTEETAKWGKVVQEAGIKLGG